MKKVILAAVVLLMTGAIFQNQFASANEEKIDIAEEQEKFKEDVTNFIKAQGEIVAVEENDEIVEITVEDETKSIITIFYISDDVLVFSNSGEPIMKNELKKGMKVEAYYDKRKPIITIYPAMITPEVLIVQDENEIGQVKIAKFDEQLVSLDNELELTISEETVLLNRDGEEIAKEDLVNEELVVFYTISTKSIPAHTAPEKVILLNEEDATDTVETVHEMVPLRQMAEELGYEVIWHSSLLQVELKKEVQTLKLTIGETSYSENDSSETFEAAPQLVDGKTYVSSSFFEKLK